MIILKIILFPLLLAWWIAAFFFCLVVSILLPVVFIVPWFVAGVYSGDWDGGPVFLFCDTWDAFPDMVGLR
ncbi:MAG: hypothetical protein V4498_02625 [candidate division FCPU426 bacterium]